MTGQSVLHETHLHRGVQGPVQASGSELAGASEPEEAAVAAGEAHGPGTQRWCSSGVEEWVGKRVGRPKRRCPPRQEAPVDRNLDAWRTATETRCKSLFFIHFSLVVIFFIV